MRRTQNISCRHFTVKMKLSIATLFLLVAELAVARQLLEQDCTVYAIADTRIETRRLGDTTTPTGELDFVCEPNGKGARTGAAGATHKLKLTPEQQAKLEEEMNNGAVVSGSTTLEGASWDGNEIVIDDDTRYGYHAPPNPRKQKSKSILVVRVTDKDGKVIGDSAAQVGDNIFGTDGDPVNLKSQMLACSYGVVDITNQYSSPNIDDKLSAPGVIDVKIDISLNNDKYVVHNAVTAAANAFLGYSLPGQHEQVMYVLEKCYQGCGWAAYAYINSWMSVYQAGYYGMPGVQMHEIGHNFGMAHSGGLNGATYTDHTCLMGNPLYKDDEGKMCFNPAKNWAVNWYDDYKIEIDITKASIGQAVEMVGVAEIKVDTNNKRPAVMKLETGTSNDYFVAFNRAVGINGDNDEADDEVTIIQTGNNGESYSQSSLKAHLVQGESYDIGDLTITATKIDKTTTPGTAIVTLTKGPQEPTTSPTVVPTAPNSSFGPTPQDFGTGEPTRGGGGDTKAPTKSPSASPSAAPTTDESCEDLSKKECKKAKDTCAHGASKIFGDCEPKKGKYKHDCSQYGADNCFGNDDNKGLCTFKDGVCAHVCDDLSKKPCKKFKNTSDKKKTCKAPKLKNPCKGCMPKNCGAD